jgi:hypothetical protein
MPFSNSSPSSLTVGDDPMNPYWKRPLDSWTVPQVADWFRKSEFVSCADKFVGLSGRSLSELSKEQLENSLELRGVALFNALAHLKRGYQRPTGE